MRRLWNLLPTRTRYRNNDGSSCVASLLDPYFRPIFPRQKCSVCDIREGACIQCSKSSCFLAFHATCARKEKFLMPMKSAHGCDAPSLTCYCEKHLTVSPRSHGASFDATKLFPERATGRQGENPRGGTGETQPQRFLSGFQIRPRIRDDVYLRPPSRPRFGR